jgi:hypothetical protein
VTKFVSDLRQEGGFLCELRLPPPIKITVTIKHDVPLGTNGPDFVNQSLLLFLEVANINFSVFV